MPSPASAGSWSQPSRPSFSRFFFRSASFVFLSLFLFFIVVCSFPLAATASIYPSSSTPPSSPAAALVIDPSSLDSLILEIPAKAALTSSNRPAYPNLEKRAQETPVAATAASSDTTTKPTKSRPTATNINTSTTGVSKPIMSSITTTATPAPTMAPDSKGDTALFGRPSVIGSFNLTSGILIYSAFMLLFLAAVGSATWQRAKYRSQFRQQQQKNTEGGRGSSGDRGSKKGGASGELSDAALFKQASISKRALMKDVGPGGVLAANEVTKTRIAAANGAGRSFEDRGLGGRSNQQESGQGVRFGESNGSNKTVSGPGSRTGGMKKPSQANVNQGSYEMNPYGQLEDPLSYYQDNHDTTDYSRPPLTESADPYYSSGSSHSGYLDQVEDYHHNSAGSHSPQRPKAAHQQHQTQHSISTTASSSPQPQYSQPIFVQRTNSSRMPKTELHSGNDIPRSNSGSRMGATTPGLQRTGSGPNGANQPSRIATEGLLERSGSGGQSGANSPIDGGMSRTGSNASSGRTRVSPSPTQMHPTPIARSNSTRLPPSMRVGTPQPPSNLSQHTNNFI